MPRRRGVLKPSHLRLRSPKSYSAPDHEDGDGEGDGEGGEGGVYLCPIRSASTPRDGARHLEVKPPAPANTLSEAVPRRPMTRTASASEIRTGVVKGEGVVHRTHARFDVRVQYAMRGAAS
jgi:hypothetical protein